MIDYSFAPQNLVTPMAAGREEARLIWPQGSLGDPAGGPLGDPAGDPGGLTWPQRLTFNADRPEDGEWRQKERQMPFFFDRAHSIAGPGVFRAWVVEQITPMLCSSHAGLHCFFLQTSGL